MLGIAAEEMQHLGDDRLGPALDRLFDTDRAALLTEVIVTVGQRFNLKFDKFHNDSTSISFCGNYRAASGRRIRGPNRAGYHLRLLQGPSPRSQATAINPQSLMLNPSRLARRMAVS